MKFSGRILLSAALTLTSITGAFAQVDSLFRNGRGISPVRSAVLVRSLKIDSVLLRVNDSVPLVPASILKCITTASLMNRVSVDDRYETKVYLTGMVSDSTLNGNVVVEGVGDPTVDSRHVKNAAEICSEIADGLRARGIDSIRGRIIVRQELWSGPAQPPTWAAADLAHYYGTGSYGFNFEDNASGDRSVADPAARFISRLTTTLRAKDIKIGGEELDPWWKSLLLTHQSPPMDEVMRSCMVRSDNQYAEALLRTFAVKNGDKGNTEQGARKEMQLWQRKGAPMQGVEIFDGSGLSRRNRVTAVFMESVLRTMSDNPYYASFFPIAGEEGTLKKYLKDTPLKGYIALKTGSMNGIQCYAGYKLDEDYNPTHTIVVMLNDMKSRTEARETLKKVLLELFVPKSHPQTQPASQAQPQPASQSAF